MSDVCRKYFGSPSNLCEGEVKQEMSDLKAGVMSLLGLAQTGLVVVGMDVSIAAFTGFSFLGQTPELFQNFTYFGGFIGALDNLYWLVTERVPKILEKL